MVTRKHAGPSIDGAGSVLSTISGPANAAPPNNLGSADPHAARLLDKVVSGQQLAAERPYNADKAGEFGAVTAPEGESFDAPSPAAGASTASETNASAKTGDGVPPQGVNPSNGPLDRARVDDSGQRLTTNQGVPIADNQNSLKVGLRGPAAMEDFILREKITHFDHERIPERVVHARGSAAHGVFEAYDDF